MLGLTPLTLDTLIARMEAAERERDAARLVVEVARGVADGETSRTALRIALAQLDALTADATEGTTDGG